MCQFLGVALYSLFTGRPNKRGSTQPSLLKVGTIEEFDPGSVTLVREGHFYLSRLDDGGFLAISRKCSHLGCAVPWVEERNRFECPCHSSVFDQTGEVLRAPAPRPLDHFPVSFEGRQLFVDISRPLRRSSFKKDQAAYFREAG